jgi:6-phosphofructokinase 1
MAYGNIALDLINEKSFGQMVCLRKGQYDNVPIEVVTSTKKSVDVDKYYNTERLRPKYECFNMKSLFLITSDL